MFPPTSREEVCHWIGGMLMNDLITRNSVAAISLWVQARAYEMIVAGFTQAETAKAITEMGRGIRPRKLEGVEYPPD
jgi:hypothetical protein